MAGIVDELNKLTKQVETVLGRQKAVDEKMAKLGATVRGLPEPVLKMTGLVKAYMDAVKKSDGAASVRPGTVKAVQAAEKAPSPKSVTAAIAELNAHVADLKGSKDKKAEKFGKAIAAIVGQLKAL